MKRALIFSLVGYFLLFGVSLEAGMKVFSRADRTQVAAPGAPHQAPGEMSRDSYKKAKFALGSFDLVNGLTRQDLQTLDSNDSVGFYYLLGCLWLVVGMRFARRRPSRK